jgi:FSR family fosmidomycin resistance protein-like MFS transporter
VCSSASPSASAGLGAAVLGHTSIAFVYQLCAFLPAIGLLAVFLPKMPKAVR